MDSFDARGLAEAAGGEAIAAATYELAKELHVGIAGPTDGAMQAAKVLGGVVASCITVVEQRKTPAQLLSQVEEAYELVKGSCR
jgi:hypothetical protein